MLLVAHVRLTFVFPSHPPPRWLAERAWQEALCKTDKMTPQVRMVVVVVPHLSIDTGLVGEFVCTFVSTHVVGCSHSLTHPPCPTPPSQF